MRRRELLAAGTGWPLVSRAAGEPIGAGERLDWPALRMLDGSTREPVSWQGQAAVLVFWATWCPYCLRHNAHVDKLHRATQGLPVSVLGLALEKDADPVSRYMTKNGYGFPVALDGGILRRQLTSRKVIPMTCLLDRQGRLLQSIPGELAEDDVLGLARAALRGTDR